MRMKLVHYWMFASMLLAAVGASAEAFGADSAVDFEREIQPIIEAACLRCHQPEQADGELRLDSAEGASHAIVAGDAAASSLYARLILPADDPEVMPPDGPRLDATQIDVVQRWIAEGAKWPADAKLQIARRVLFEEHVQPLLEANCIACHQADNAEGEIDLSTRSAATEVPGMITPFRPDESTLYDVVSVAKDDPRLMPPLDHGGPLSSEEIETLRLWIAQGAVWPEGVRLAPRAKAAADSSSPDGMALVERIRQQIVAKAAEEADAPAADYTEEIPLTETPFDLVALEGGEFQMGSPAGESGRREDEGPQRTVRVAPFWIGKCEVSWDEYEPFMLSGVDRLKNGTRKDFDPAQHTDVDAVSQPTAPYTEMSFGMGQYGYPAISMTQHAANKYCQWLSAQTGHFYRLPTEAEWEYACRAGTTTAYSFGDDAAELDDYAWHAANSDEKYQLVGQKEPNPWGLHDMHGNVAEWTADQYSPEYFDRLQPEAENPFVRPTTLYPRSVRGGGWAEGPETLRSASRRGSEAAWQQQDPQLPKSLWYLTDAPWLGFRVVRPREIPSAEEMYFYWNSSSPSLLTRPGNSSDQTP
jgi:formylglycine-generating enzyme required for sulfatase activity